MYLLQLLDHHVCSGTTLLLLALCQSISIGWVYGEATNHRPPGLAKQTELHLKTLCSSSYSYLSSSSSLCPLLHLLIVLSLPPPPILPPPSFLSFSQTPPPPFPTTTFLSLPLLHRCTSPHSPHPSRHPLPRQVLTVSMTTSQT